MTTTTRPRLRAASTFYSKTGIFDLVEHQNEANLLPFLRNQQEASASAPVESVKRESDEGVEFDSLEVAMQDLFSAKSDKERAAAFRAAFELLESQPHEEGPHE